MKKLLLILALLVLGTWAMAQTVYYVRQATFEWDDFINPDAVTYQYAIVNAPVTTVDRAYVDGLAWDAPEITPYTVTITEFYFDFEGAGLTGQYVIAVRSILNDSASTWLWSDLGGSPGPWIVEVGDPPAPEAVTGLRIR